MADPDVPGRLRALLPPWFPDADEVLDGLLAGIAALLKHVLRLIAFAKRQTRFATATGAFVDLAAFDFLGLRFLRRAGEADPDFSLRARREVLRPRATRAAVIQAVTDLVGTPPEVFEPFNPDDCGAYDVGTCAYAGELPQPAIAGYDCPIGGYDTGGAAFVSPLPAGAYGSSKGAGCYGSYELENQVFIKVRRPTQVGTQGPDAAGYAYYDAPSAGFGGGQRDAPRYQGYDAPAAVGDLGPCAYIEPDGRDGPFPGAGTGAPNTFQGTKPVTDAEIYATIAATVAEGVIAWVALDAP